MENMKVQETQQEQAAVGAEAEEMREAMNTGTVNMEEPAKKQEAEKSANYTHVFKSPVTIMNKQYKTMTFYFDRLTGTDVEAIEAELQDQNKYVLSPEISSVFQSMLAARAAGVASDEIKRLPVRDYMKIKNKARDFLINVGY